MRKAVRSVLASQAEPAGAVTPCLPRLVLASASPRRRALLARLSVRFAVQAPAVEESPRANEQAPALARRLAEAKADAVAATQPAYFVLAADTVVAVDGSPLGKPTDEAEAIAMLRRLRGREHTVITGLCLLTPSGSRRVRAVATRVRMRQYSDGEIATYVASGDPLDKAGAYAIQHPRFRPVEALLGCYTNVVGLPLCMAGTLLRQAGLSSIPAPAAVCPHPNGWTAPPTAAPR